MGIVVEILRWITVASGLFFVGGTLLSLSRHPHWFIRGWDFPRMQIAGLAALAGLVYALFFLNTAWYEWAFVLACAATVLWQGYRIFPYAPVAPARVKRSSAGPSSDASVRLVASNVLMENEQYEHWLSVIRAADPDIILAVEVDDVWAEQIDVLREAYPHVVAYPQDNYYGMVLFSRLELIDPEVRFIVEDDVPSIHTNVRLRDGQTIYLHGVHPRPPEPLRDQNATQRDAEVVVVGREIAEEERPTIVAGDFNDVAWSHTSELFLDIGKLLDPRKGRGFFNSFDANSYWFRFPLDHVFHSNEFKLIELKLLDHVGSDHFPVLLELSYEPEAQMEQPEPETDAGEEEEAEEKVERAEEEEGHVEKPPFRASSAAQSGGGAKR